MIKVFIDGSAGTTGLKIVDRLSLRDDISLIKLPEELRKDINARKDAINSSDVTFLCLPDAAAIESASLVENDSTVIIDTSTAHRVNPDWTYGFAEIEDYRVKIASSKKIANPGCHASGFISLVNPLVKAGVIDKNINLTCISLTGYTGGGKKTIEQYENNIPNDFLAPRQYGLTQMHKHLPEMKFVTGIENAPVFCPIIAPFPQGMEVTVPLFKSDIKCSVEDIKEIYRQQYNSKIVHFDNDISENGFISANIYAGRDDMSITVYGNEDRILLVSRFDNLGKGASGAAIQNMNIVLGVEEDKGLNV